MKTSISFTLVSDWIKRISGSWTTTKTTDDIAKKQVMDHEITHAALPEKKDTPITTKTYADVTLGEDYCSTY